MGDILYNAREYERAKKAFEQAIKINPKYPEAHYKLGSILFNQGKYNRAIAAFRRSALANPNYPNAYYGAGLTFVQLRQYAQAIQVFRYAIDLYRIQGNQQWQNNAEQQLQQAQQLNSQPR